MSVSYECLAAIAVTLLPNFGFFVIVDLTEDNGRWYSMLEHPSWGVTTGEIYFPLLLTVNFFQGYASFLTWEAGGREWRTLPILFYGVNLFLLWIHFPIFLGCRSLTWGTVDISLALCSALGTTYLFFQEHTVAGFLMLPYICVLAYDTMRDIWMFYMNGPGKRTDNKPEGEAK